MIWNAPTDTTSRIRPTTSIRALARLVSNGDSSVKTPNAQIATTGRLMKKIHGQLQLSLIVPPRIGPRIGAVVVVIDHIARPLQAVSFGKMRRRKILDRGIAGTPASP